MKPLLVVSPCEHGQKLTIKELQEGCDFVDPNCKFANGTMREHTATQDKYSLAPVRKADGRFIPPWVRE